MENMKTIINRFENEDHWELGTLNYIATDDGVAFSNDLDYSEFRDWCYDNNIAINHTKGCGMFLITLIK